MRAPCPLSSLLPPTSCQRAGHSHSPCGNQVSETLFKMDESNICDSLNAKHLPHLKMRHSQGAAGLWPAGQPCPCRGAAGPAPPAGLGMGPRASHSPGGPETPARTPGRHFSAGVRVPPVRHKVAQAGAGAQAWAQRPRKAGQLPSAGHPLPGLASSAGCQPPTRPGCHCSP